MAASVTLVLESHVVRVEHGLWCAACALPAASGVRLVVVLGSDPTAVVGRLAVWACEDCGVVRSGSWS